MNLQKALNYYYSIKNLKTVQILSLFRKRVLKLNIIIPIISGEFKNVDSKTNFIFFKKTLYFENGKKYFLFINKKKIFTDWDMKAEPLWQYNLFYFDYLMQKDITKDIGLELIYSSINFLKKNPYSKMMDPYPTSLRVVNWLKFISRFKINDEKINKSILFQLSILFESLEYDLMANHLLTNLLSLKFSLSYFNGKNIKFFQKIVDFLLKRELKEQINGDGLHYERSFMYSNITLLMLLDLVNINHNKYKDISIKMLQTSYQFSIENNMPLFNDAANNIATNITDILDYSKDTGIDINLEKKSTYLLEKSNFVKKSNKNITLFFDGGGDLKYQVGHIHSSALSFELYFKDKKIFTDIGTYTYLVSPQRDYLRATKSHNTISINGKNQSNIWSSFRVAQRAKYYSLTIDKSIIKSQIDGYSKYKHIRTIKLKDNNIIIVDTLFKKGDNRFELTFNLTPFLNDKILIIDKKVILDNHITLSNSYTPQIENIEYYPEFNKIIDSKAIKYYGDFNNYIKITTIIEFK